MKKKTFAHSQWMKKTLCFVLAFAMVFSSMTITPQAASVKATTEAELIAKTSPILKSYEVSDADGVWTVKTGTRFVVEATGSNIENDRLAEVVKLINAEFVEKEIASSKPHTMVYGPAGSQLPEDILIRIVPVEDITGETDSDETYKITINNLGVVIEAASEDAVLYALRTIQTMMITNNGLVYGTITDWPDLAERRLHVDAGRKYFTKEWFFRQIREMSYMKLNTLQFHFAENKGFRIECETDPSIVSEDHLTKAEVREIIAEANKYGIDVIPSLDTPGHVEQILKAHPEYGQVDINGSRSTTALDITNPEAVEFIYSLYDEYMELFEGCEHFQIGADEYMEYDRYPFTSLYMPVLNDYAEEKYGAGYTWREAMAGYTNDLAEYVYSKGFKPRIFNDGVYFHEGTANQQKFPMHDYIGIDYWSRTSWIGGSPDLQTFINRGHKEIYNFNASYFYYVLRSGPQSDGRPAHSFDVKNQDANIYNNWTPGEFQGNTKIADDHEVIAGVALSIWCDYPDVCTEDVVHEDVQTALQAMATKSWNLNSKSVLSHEEFLALSEELGHAAAYEKGSELPEVGEFSELTDLGKVTLKYQDTKGNTIKEDDVMYGSLGSKYSFTAPAIYLWIAESDKAVTGTYSEKDGEIIFVYDIDPNPVMYASDMASFPSVREYLTTGKEFALNEASRFVIISSNLTLQNAVLESDLKLLSSEFTEVGLTEESMNIVYGTDATVKPGDIVIRMEDASDDISPESYTINIGNAAEVTATGEAGIFYGIRTIQKTMLLNGGKMDCGKITDEPGVEVRGFHLDAARKFFTKEWIIALIKDLSYQNYNVLQYHFSENEGYRLESSTLEEKIPGWHYPSDGYLTKEDVLEIIEVCNQYHVEFIPSLDSPGHMEYILEQFSNPNDWNCTSIWSASSDFRSPQVFNIYEKEECRQFLKDLFTEYAEFFSEAGCKHMNIGGDEFLNNFGNMTNEQYVTVMNYFNEISALVKSYGLTPRAWNDGLMYSGYSGYKLDSDIEICYWSGPAQVATIDEFTANGNKVINMSDTFMYYVLGSWWMSAANPEGDRIYSEWHPGKFPSARNGAQVYDYPYPDNVLGASFAVWCDTPSMLTQDQIASNIFMRTRATAEKCWNPTTTVAYSNLTSYSNKLGRVPGYGGSELPAPGEIYAEGSMGTIVLRYVDTDGNTLKKDRTVYGLIDDAYTITPDKLYGYRFVSMDKDAEGIYTEKEIVVTLTYELYTDKTELQAAVNGAAKENDCIPGTYDEFGEALKAAKAALADKKATQESVDASLKALKDAEKSIISLDRVDLYLAVTYPVSSAGYTSGSYSDYTNAISAANTVLHNPNATEEEVDAALENVLAKKDALTVVTDLVSVSANKGTYSGWGDGTYGNWPLSNILDGDPSSKAWINGAQTVGDWFLFTFAKPVELNTFRIEFANGADYIYQADVQISADNNTWTTIGTIDNTTNPQYDMSFSTNGETVQYVKITITKTVDNWTQITEASFNYNLNETVDTSALEAAIGEAKALNKDDYSTASWTVLEAALANAETIAAKEDATAGEVNAALNALNGTIETLVAPGEEPEDAEVVRLFGQGRYDTAYAVSDTLKAVLGVEKFEAVVVATGTNFADALAGSYLAVEKNAPILLTNGKDANVAQLHAYIKANVAEGGKVYILGGDGAVPITVDTIDGYEVERLFGDSRYDTNLEILKEAGVTGDSIIVATGKTFADSLSASAAKLPILLVKPNAVLNDAQKEVLTGMKNIYIVGGEGAVSAEYEAELAAFGEVTRVFGDSRYDTSVEVAKTFCKDVDFAVVASGKNFPDGLCGGPLAAAMNAPLVLTKDGGSSAAANYVAENGIASGYVLGGDGALKDATVVTVFGLESAAEIK